MIFEFRKEGSKISHYLMGTMHTQDKRAFGNIGLAMDKMSMCNLYMGEMDFGKVDSRQFQNAFLISKDLHLNNVLKPKKYEKCRKILLKSFGMDLNNFCQYAPMFIQSILSSTIFNHDFEVSLDAYLYQQALHLNLPTDGLESMEDQFIIAQKLDFKTQLKTFVSLCEKPDKFRQQLLNLIDAYARNDGKGIYKTGKKSLGINRKILLYDRNINMTQKIQESCQKNVCFISVGAGHLYGNSGILSGLKKNKFKLINLT